jgi:hypothetical protein
MRQNQVAQNDVRLQRLSQTVLFHMGYPDLNEQFLYLFSPSYRNPGGPSIGLNPTFITKNDPITGVKGK